MRHEWINNGLPFPSGHAKAGQVGLTIFYEDGRPHPTQNVYAASKEAMADKLVSMYANTSERLREVKTATPPPPAKHVPMSTEQRLQLTSDLEDPAKAPQAILSAIREATGGVVDLEKDALVKRLRAASDQFILDNPDYHPSERNALIIRDRTLSRDGDITAEGMTKSLIELRAVGAIESAPDAPEPPEDEEEEPLDPPPVASTPVVEPSAPQPPARPRTSTGARPMTFSRATTVPPATPKITYQKVLDMVANDPDGYARKLATDPEFVKQVNEVTAPYL